MTLLEKEWFIEAPWGKLCVVAWGECSSPPVLLCHGVVDTAATFRPLVKLLPRDFYYIALELPGNGRSDHYPPGMMVSAYDLVYAIAVVVGHFRWDQFRYIAHSLGTVVGFLYDLSYPGKMTHVVNLDPVSRALTVSADEFAQWYHKYFTKYYEKYDIYNGRKETEPKHQWTEALEKLMKKRHLKEPEAVETLLRMSEPVAEGVIRYTYDQRMRIVTRPPLSPQNLRRILTSIPTPTLSIIAEQSVRNGTYEHAEFVFDESAYPLNNYRVRRVEGTHDVHLISPEKMAGWVGQFLLYGVDGLESKAKL